MQDMASHSHHENEAEGHGISQPQVQKWYSCYIAQDLRRDSKNGSCEIVFDLGEAYYLNSVKIANPPLEVVQQELGLGAKCATHCCFSLIGLVVISL